MLILIFLFIIVTLCKNIGSIKSSMLPDGTYITRERTTTINGIFIWLVFLSHISGYMQESFPTADSCLLRNSVGYIGQCVVATFFFFSGFGIMASLQKSGTKYATSLLKNRFLLLLFHMSMAVLIFTAVQYSFGKSMPVSQIFLSFIGWDSVGNSNWFIFISLLSYVFISCSYLLFRNKSHIVVVACVAILFGASIQLLKFKGGWWVDTCLCIPAGMLFCSLRTKIESIIRIIPIPVWLIGILTTLFGVIFYRHSIGLFGLYGPNIGAITFATGITLIFSAVNFKSIPSFLHWSGGSALFYLYIFQRLPMLIGYRLGWPTQSPYLYEVFCFCITIAIAFVCVQIFPRIDKRIVSFLKKDVNSCS